MIEPMKCGEKAKAVSLSFERDFRTNFCIKKHCTFRSNSKFKSTYRTPQYPDPSGSSQ